MILKPDLERPIIDPFNSHTTVNIFCDILDAVKKDPYERDPRGTAKKAEAYLKKSGIGDKSYFGPEPEFFVFDDVRFKNDMNETSFRLIVLKVLTIQEKNMKMVTWDIDLELKVVIFQFLQLIALKI